MERENLSKGELFVLDWQMGRSGSFFSSLAEAMIRADGYNTSRLSLGFPEEVLAMYNFQNTAGWWEDVQERAGS